MSAVSRYLLAVVGAAIFSGFAGFALLSLLERPPSPKLPVGQVPVTAPGPGTLSLEAPPGTAVDALRVTLLESGKPAVSADGKKMARLTADELHQQAVKPGLYLARIFYRGKPVVDLAVKATSGVEGVIPLPGRKLATAEYDAGIAADSRRAGDGIPYFKRTAQLDERHVDARLQLAAYELLKGSVENVRAHLATLKRLDPDNREAAAIARILRERQRRE